MSRPLSNGHGNERSKLELELECESLREEVSEWRQTAEKFQLLFLVGLALIASVLAVQYRRLETTTTGAEGAMSSRGMAIAECAPESHEPALSGEVAAEDVVVTLSEQQLVCLGVLDRSYQRIWIAR